MDKENQQTNYIRTSYFRSKLFLMSWCPDTAKIKKKMIYSSSFDTLKKAFVGVHKVIQSNDVDGLEKDYIEGILKSTDRNSVGIDPFCKLSIGKEKAKTKIIERSSSPVWKEAVSLAWVEGYSTLTIQILDWKTAGLSL